MASSSLNSVAINLSFGIRKTPYQGEEHSLQGLPVIRLYWDFFSLTNENHKQRAWCYVYYYWDFVFSLDKVIVIDLNADLVGLGNVVVIGIVVFLLVL